MRTSVCMAAYNGARHIYEQINSILPQLDREAEIIVIDDSSTDDTVKVVEGIGDGRIRLIRHDRNLGVVKTFERAIRESRGEIIFLADQDDVWCKNKVDLVRNVFLSQPEISLVISDAIKIDRQGTVTSNTVLYSKSFHPGLVQNLVRNSYLGCTMAFRRSLLNYCLPFPGDTPMHDMWIGLVNQLVGRAEFIPEPLISYRRHGDNFTTGKHASLGQMVVWRFALVKNLLNLYLRRIAFRSRGPNGLLG
jgi:glycosyltransferase involved in cell wall biosynthesis